jgi:hypothetical protein
MAMVRKFEVMSDELNVGPTQNLYFNKFSSINIINNNNKK